MPDNHIMNSLHIPIYDRHLHIRLFSAGQYLINTLTATKGELHDFITF